MKTIMAVIVVAGMVLLTSPIRPSQAQKDDQFIESYCAFLNHAANFDKQYFCHIVDAQMLSFCGIKGTMDSLCFGIRIKGIIKKCVVAILLVISFIVAMIYIRKRESRSDEVEYIHSNPNEIKNKKFKPKLVGDVKMETNMGRSACSESNDETRVRKRDTYITKRGERVTNAVSSELSELYDETRVTMRDARVTNRRTRVTNVVSGTQPEITDEKRVTKRYTRTTNHLETEVRNTPWDNTSTVITTATLTDHPPMETTARANKINYMAPESLQYELAVLKAATSNFADYNMIGRGGFGCVYKGILSNGQRIAVKRLSITSSNQGDREFQNEISILARLRHRNLVRLLGFCDAEDEVLLVYEFVTNKSLDKFLFDDLKRKELNWSYRFNIIKGIAKGMMYLHEDSPYQTMHRDLKSANILLDADMNPKISDFGTASICEDGETHLNLSRVVGTYGYMAPEYLLLGQFSAKSDVYALGVVILETISGRKIYGNNLPENQNLLPYAQSCWEKYRPLDIVDPMLKKRYSREEAMKCIELGLQCVKEDSALRPTTSMIVHELNSCSTALMYV